MRSSRVRHNWVTFTSHQTKNLFMVKRKTIKKLFSSSSLSSIRMVSSAYLRLLIFLQAILIPAYASSNPAFHVIYSAHKLNKQGDIFLDVEDESGRWGRDKFSLIKLLSHVQLFATPGTAAHETSLSILSFCLFILFMGFSRQEYWSGLPFPSPEGII